MKKNSIKHSQHSNATKMEKCLSFISINSKKNIQVHIHKKVHRNNQFIINKICTFCILFEYEQSSLFHCGISLSTEHLNIHFHVERVGKGLTHIISYSTRQGVSIFVFLFLLLVSSDIYIYKCIENFDVCFCSIKCGIYR